ncbi:hypothetical protein FRC04_001780 [Tulasnella sp. 424]|nr:hypothetical protein FRC04_001780 [Tulasnella sp. 424]KAG8968174.1 hypothetical protein FRC05_001651 [Tulasnella sp. 425]
MNEIAVYKEAQDHGDRSRLQQPTYSSYSGRPREQDYRHPLQMTIMNAESGLTGSTSSPSVDSNKAKTRGRTARVEVEEPRRTPPARQLIGKTRSRWSCAMSCACHTDPILCNGQLQQQ